jgi:hypothetical protein
VNALFRGTEVAKMVLHQMLAFNSLGPWMMFGSVLGHPVNVWNVKNMQNLCIRHECTILGYRSCEISFAPNASIVLLWTQNDFFKCFGTSVNLPHVKRCNTCVSGVSALFRGTDVAKMDSHQMHWFKSLGPTMMFCSVL